MTIVAAKFRARGDSAFAGRPCMDGGLAIPFPLRHAIADGCTDILVLLSHPVAYVQPEYALWQDVLFRTMCARGSAGSWRTYRDYVKVSIQYRDLAIGRTPPPEGVNIATVCTEPPYVASLTMDRAALMRASADFGRRTLAALGATWADWNLGPASAARLENAHPRKPRLPLPERWLAGATALQN